MISRPVTPGNDDGTTSDRTGMERHVDQGHHLDLSDALTLLDAARQLLDELHGIGYSDTTARTPVSSHAETSRRLQAAASQLRRAACEVEAQYWVGRGFPDPLEGAVA